MAKTRVVVVDDSALVRSLLSSLIDAQPDMECVGVAQDPLVAREIIRETSPDVVTLDIEMPKMDGLDFLERLMRLRPTPVVMVSTLTERGAEVTLKALELGAVDFVAKPKIGLQSGLQEMGREICEKIRLAARSRVRRLADRPAARAAPSKAAAKSFLGTERLVAIGASTGGTEAIRAVLQELPGDFPAVVITQHMPVGFTRSFAARLDQQCALNVKEATHRERILPGCVYIAPGGQHLTIKRDGSNYVAVLDAEEPVNRHRPSVEKLMMSVAACAGRNAIGVMLTGMGADGAQGMLAMHKAGAWTIAQDEASCVVFGMPREAIAAGGVSEVLPLQRIAQSVLGRVRSAGAVLHRV